MTHRHLFPSVLCATTAALLSSFPVQSASASPGDFNLGGSLAEVLTNGDYGQIQSHIEESLPESLDWRSSGGIDYASPVKNQARCGSCVAFAVTSTFETQMNIATGVTFQPWSFSPQHLFSCGSGDCVFGWELELGVDDLIRKGLPEEACFPYVSGATGAIPSCRATCVDAGARGVKPSLRVRSAPRVGASISDVKLALLGGPVATVMRVYDDLYDYQTGVYRHRSGGLAGGHAVMIVGWDNSEKSWIVRNSWGTHWGDKGDFRIAWDDVSGVGGTFFGFKPPPDLTGVILEGIRDRTFLQGPTKLSLKLHGLSLVSAALEIRGKNGALITKPFLEAKEVTLDPAEIPDGTYTVQARAKTSQNVERVSQAYLVFVRNGEAKATITIRRMTPNMNVWETITPTFEITSSPVPLARVQYRLVNQAGETVLTRAEAHTADLVGINLNPRKLAVGRYLMIAEAISDAEEVLATDQTTFNVIPGE